MAKEHKADANPEKRLFISLLTRDIPLVAAFLDLVDNSINSAVEPYSKRLKSAENYQAVFADKKIQPHVDIDISISGTKISIIDTAGGISLTTAREHVFKFGRANDEAHEGDRLSVYGIGLKRAMFKLGNRIQMRSDHVEGGFDLDLDVSKWSKDTSQPWTFVVKERKPVTAEKTGTSIIISELYHEVEQRVEDGVFLGQLQESVSKTYAYYLAKFVRISVNGKQIDGTNIELGDNHSAGSIKSGSVTCAITAGIGTSDGGVFRDKSSGWFVFCNGRAVISADKTPLTGWGGTTGLPIFQPKHRPFLGIVFFVSENPEELPWTTTKSTINEDSAVWQAAKRHMVSVGRSVISFLDGRYTDAGTEVASKELQTASGKKVSALSAAAAGKQKSFKAPKAKSEDKVTKIQYDAPAAQVRKIAEYLKKPSMSGSDVGRHTFSHFIRNEVGED